jgi:hypothetical protein
VNRIPANSRHFPAGNVDFTAVFAIFPGKVNHFSTNLRHFPCPLEKGIPVFLEEELLFYRYEKILVFLTVTVG